MIAATTLTNTFSNLGVITIVELTGLVLNMFCTSVFLKLTLEHIIQGHQISIIANLTSHLFVCATSFVDLIVAVGIIDIFLFQVMTSLKSMTYFTTINIG
jgi:hypothetical protein